MRITFLLPHAGMYGGIRVVAIYARRLSQRGHDVNVVSTLRRVPGRRNRAIQRARRFVQRLRSDADSSHFDFVDVPHRVLNHYGPITNHDVPDGDVVVATWWETAEWAMELSPRKGEKAYFVQGYELNEGQPVDRLKRTWTLPIHKIAVAQWLADIAADEFGDHDVSIVPNAVDLELFRSEERGKQPVPTVGMLYSTRPCKGCDIVLQAYHKAARAVPQLRLKAFGAARVSARLPLPARVKYVRAPAQEELRNIYGSCDAWLFGSRTEGFGLPLLEAMACRTPVIATPAGASRDLLARGGGWLVKPEDPDDMALAIERVAAASESQWREMSQRALETARGHTWEVSTERFETALQVVVDRGRRREVNDVTGRRRMSA